MHNRSGSRPSSLLNSWFEQCVLLDEDAAHAANAAYPRGQARIVVNDVPGQPGA